MNQTCVAMPGTLQFSILSVIAPLRQINYLVRTQLYNKLRGEICLLRGADDLAPDLHGSTIA